MKTNNLAKKIERFYELGTGADTEDLERLNEKLGLFHGFVIDGALDGALIRNFFDFTYDLRSSFNRGGIYQEEYEQFPFLEAVVESIRYDTSEGEWRVINPNNEYKGYFFMPKPGFHNHEFVGKNQGTFMGIGIKCHKGNQEKAILYSIINGAGSGSAIGENGEVMQVINCLYEDSTPLEIKGDGTVKKVIKSKLMVGPGIVHIGDKKMNFPKPTLIYAKNNDDIKIIGK